MLNRTRRTALLSAGAVALAGIGGIATSQSATAAPGCQVDYVVSGQWGGQYQGSVTVTNLGPAVTSWTVGWTFADGQQVNQLWNGTASQSGAAVTVTNAPYNGTLGTDASTSFGFIGTWGTQNTVPTAFTLNGTPCTGSVTTPEPTPDPTDEPTAEPTVEPTEEPTTDPGPVDPAPTGGLYVDTDTQAYDAWTSASGTDKQLLEKIALTPQTVWVGDWASADETRQMVSDHTGRALAAGQTTSLAIYAIPGRDCGNHSGGGVATSEYARWIDTVASGIQGSPLIVLEPDGLAMLGDCDGQGDRVGYLKHAAQKLTEAGGRVFIDIGHSGWHSPAKAADLLNQVGFAHAEGFALNTSNYQTTADSKAYGEQISALTGGASYVIDTSRNGNGSNGEWCNPRGRALGEQPRLVEDGSNLAALLWVKLPGESDGACNGGPGAGQWWQDMALELARNASW
ncbi:glycoside hydrolase family 6 protein [Sanguibacter suaedae]|uniref:Glucanase n=1 Tax=Sanguibacter suaedae TaxID=2795737 RepID=A0A934I9S3_9MICO|nr:glycoside hydrolase family 6 protein [Sanguibacter suaedae]MBI9113961.1 glycoside hydrolase family 6 protein [Sanguibacter suaedae]